MLQLTYWQCMSQRFLSEVVGDLNCNLIPEDKNDCNTNELKFVTNMYQYKQLIQEPTRVTIKTKSLIDHFFYK